MSKGFELYDNKGHPLIFNYSGSLSRKERALLVEFWRQISAQLFLQKPADCDIKSSSAILACGHSPQPDAD